MLSFPASVFFNVNEFAQAGTLDGDAVVGILDTGYSFGDVGSVGMAQTQPIYTLPTTYVAGDPVGLDLVVNSTTYIVAAHEPDGAGVSRLVLEVAS